MLRELLLTDSGKFYEKIRESSVADPGFSRGRGANSKGGCKKLLFSHSSPPPKLHETGRIWTQEVSLAQP